MAVASSARWLWLMAVVFAVDRATKYAIERFTTEGFRRPLIPGVADLVHSVNPGIAFGLLAESSSQWVSVALMAGSFAVVLLLLALLVTGRAGDPPVPAGIASIAGGALGNLFDRLFHGGVTDFIELRAGRFVWPAFNAADTAITVGAVLIAVAIFRGDPRAAGERA